MTLNIRNGLQFSSIMLATVGLHALAFWYLLEQETMTAMMRAAPPAAPISVFLLPPVSPPMPAPSNTANAITENAITEFAPPPPPESASITPTPPIPINTRAPTKFTDTVKKATQPLQKIPKKEKINKISSTKTPEKPKLTPIAPQKNLNSANKAINAPPTVPALPHSATNNIIAPQSPTPTPTPIEQNAPSVPVKKTPPRFDAAYLHNPSPDYPVLSKRLREQGTVLLKVKVNTAGRAEQVLIEKSSGFERLDQAADNVVQRWQFIPAREGDTPITAWVIVPIAFILR